MLSLISLAFSVLIFEVIFHLIENNTNNSQIHSKFSYSGDFRKESDRELGYSIFPNSEINASLKVHVNNEEHFCYKDITYNSDYKGRRISIEKNYNSTKHALFFGCSFAFGVGLENNQTLPSVFQSKSSNTYKSYNYAQSGHCAAQMFIKLGKKENFDDITSSKGCAIYLYIDGHLNRSSGLYEYLKWYPWYPIFAVNDKKLDGPFYWLSGNHRFQHKLKLRQIFDHTASGRFINNKFLQTCLNEEDSIWANILLVEKCKALYQSMFPNNPFIVLNWTRSGATGKSLDLFKKEYAKRGIHFFTPELIPDKDLSYLHKYDDHPSRHETKWVAQELQNYIDDLE